MMANKKMKIILMNKVNCKQMTVGTWVFIYILLLSVTADELRVPRPHLHKLVLLMLCNVFVSMDHAIQITNTTEFVITLCRKLVCQMGYLTNFYCILWCILRMHTDCLQCILGKTDIKWLRSLLTSFFFSFLPGFTWNT